MKNTKLEFANVWDAIESDPMKAENMKLRSNLMIAISVYAEKSGLTQAELAEKAGITQPRISALLSGKINDYQLDMLVDIAHRLARIFHTLKNRANLCT